MNDSLVTGEQLMVYMKDHQITVEAMARLLGLSHRQVSRYRTGGANIPRVTQIAIYAVMHWRNAAFVLLLEDAACRGE